MDPPTNPLQPNGPLGSALIRWQRFREPRRSGIIRRRSLDGNQMAFFEIAQRPRDRLTRRADELGDFLVSQGSLIRVPSLVCWIPSVQVSKQPRQFFLRGGREPDRVQLLARASILRTHLPYDVFGSFGMSSKEAQEIFPAHERDLARMDRFGRHFIRQARHGGHQPKQLSRPGNPHDQGLAFGGS